MVGLDRSSRYDAHREKSRRHIAATLHGKAIWSPVAFTACGNDLRPGAEGLCTLISKERSVTACPGGVTLAKSKRPSTGVGFGFEKSRESQQSSTAASDSMHRPGTQSKSPLAVIVRDSCISSRSANMSTVVRRHSLIPMECLGAGDNLEFMIKTLDRFSEIEDRPRHRYPWMISSPTLSCANARTRTIAITYVCTKPALASKSASVVGHVRPHARVRWNG
jgi:hypothetical protein